MSEDVRGATGVGSWPGESPQEAVKASFGLLADAGLPYLPELPGRGPGADLIGRTASLLVDLPVDLQPSGWRFTARPGRDQHRAEAFLRSDLDALAEQAHDYEGRLKLQVCGPWTLLSGIDLNRGERTVADPGARRDVVASLAQGVADHLDAVRRQVPAAELVVQLDEPSLPAVIEGRLPTRSGVGRIRAVEAAELSSGLATVLDAVRSAGAVSTAVHCCAPGVPFPTLRQAGPDALAVDVALLGPPAWESVAVAVEAGTRLWAGAVPTDGSEVSVTAIVDRIVGPWKRIGLTTQDLARVVISPGCGLAGVSPTQAVQALRTAVKAAEALREEA